MKLYKVILDNNVPISAAEISFSHLQDRADIAINEDGSVKWMPVLGFNEQDSLDLAKKIISGEASPPGAKLAW